MARRRDLALIAAIVTVPLAVAVVPGSPGQAASASSAGVGPPRPNVVLILVDDMRDDELDAPWMRKTQRLLGEHGVRFSNSFAPLPLCCPARASILTGQYPHNHGVWGNLSPYGFHALDDSQTLAVWLQRAGYRTGFLGKYLNGYGQQEPYDGDNRPPVVDGSSSSYVPPGWNDWRASLAGTYHYFRTRISDQGLGTTSLRGRYQTRAYGDVASQMIRAYAALRRPFFLVTSFTAPHSGRPLEDDDPPPVSDDGEVIGRVVTPAVPDDRRNSYNDVVVKLPGRGEASVRDKPEELRLKPPTEAQRAALLEATRQRAEAESVVDDQVRRIVATLRTTGELDNTYIIFASDNGYLLGEHRVKQGKLLPWDPSLRVPFLVRGPGIPAGEVRSDPISVVDWAPTILQMAGAPTPAGHKLDGVPLLDIARFGDRGWVRAIGTESGPKNRQGVGGRQRGIRTPRYLYTDYGAGEEELYDLALDPWQNCNLLGPLWARRADPDCEAIGGDQPLRPSHRRAADALRDLRDEFEPVGPGRGCAGRSCRQLLLPDFLRTRPIPRPPVYWQSASQQR